MVTPGGSKRALLRWCCLTIAHKPQDEFILLAGLSPGAIYLKICSSDAVLVRPFWRSNRCWSCQISRRVERHWGEIFSLGCIISPSSSTMRVSGFDANGKLRLHIRAADMRPQNRWTSTGVGNVVRVRYTTRLAGFNVYRTHLDWRCNVYIQYGFIDTLQLAALYVYYEGNVPCIRASMVSLSTLRVYAGYMYIVQDQFTSAPPLHLST